MQQIKEKDFINQVKNGRIFTATFIKKDGTIRKMNCRVGVAKYTKGVGLSFDADSKGLLPVYDLQKKAYRFVNLKTLKTVRLGHQEFEVIKD